MASILGRGTNRASCCPPSTARPVTTVSAREPPRNTGINLLALLAIPTTASCVLSPSSATKSRPKVAAKARQSHRRPAPSSTSQAASSACTLRDSSQVCTPMITKRIPAMICNTLAGTTCPSSWPATAPTAVTPVSARLAPTKIGHVQRNLHVCDSTASCVLSPSSATKTSANAPQKVCQGIHISFSEPDLTIIDRCHTDTTPRAGSHSKGSLQAPSVHGCILAHRSCVHREARISEEG